MPDLYGYFHREPTDYTRSFKTIHFWVEVKRPGGRRRPAQTAWIEAARRDGVIAFFASSVEEMVAGFKEFGIVIGGLP